jgi:hypothetical protein
VAAAVVLGVGVGVGRVGRLGRLRQPCHHRRLCLRRAAGVSLAAAAMRPHRYGVRARRHRGSTRLSSRQSPRRAARGTPAVHWGRSRRCDGRPRVARVAAHGVRFVLDARALASSQDLADAWTVCAGFNLTSVLERPDGKGSSLEDALGGEDFFAPPTAHVPPVRCAAAAAAARPRACVPARRHRARDGAIIR